MAQIQGSGTGNNTNTGFVDNSIEPQLGRLWVSSSGTSTQLYSDTDGPSILDKGTFSIPTIDYPHYTIHDGRHYSVRGFDLLSSVNDRVNFGVITPNGSTWAHMFFQIEGNNQTEVRMWEGATMSGGTSVTPTNSNRNSNDASLLTVYKNPIISGLSPTSGTLIESNSKGLAGTPPSKAGIGGGITREDEWVLKSGTSYLWEIKTAGASNTVDYNGYWYENTNKVKQF